MLEQEVLVNEKLDELFGSKYACVTIQSNAETALLLIETKVDYALVTAKDFTHLPIGDYDVFIEKRVKKTDNTIRDIAEMICFLQMDTERNIKKLKDNIVEITGALVNAGKTFQNNSVLVSNNSETKTNNIEN